MAIIVIDAANPISMKAVQERLGVPQHVLIHLCEEGVVEPDFADADGRGKRRQFSRKNVLEFAVALRLREFGVAVAYIAICMGLLRQFGADVRDEFGDLWGPEFLGRPGVRCALHFYDGARFGFELSMPKHKPMRISLGLPPPDGAPRETKVRAGALPDDFEAHLEVDLSRLAKRIFLLEDASVQREEGERRAGERTRGRSTRAR